MQTISTTLSSNQRTRVAKGLPVRLSNKQLTSGGVDRLPLTARQFNRVKKARTSGKGVVLRFTKGGGLLDGLAVKAIPLLSKAAPLVSRIASPLATGAVTALGSLGIDKLFGSGVHVPKGKVRQLAKHFHELTPTQKRNVMMAAQVGSGVTIKPTKKQRGGFLGSLLASMVIGKLLGGGLQNRVPGMEPYISPIALRRSGYGLQNRMPGLVPYAPPISLGRGKKKKRSGKGLLLGKHSPFSGVPLLGAIL